MKDQLARVTRTTCPYCGVGCGVLAIRQTDGSIQVQGDPEHPANKGRLCSKGSALAETIGLSHRILNPQLEGQDASWDKALNRVADGFKQVIAEHGPDAVAFYVSGQLLTEDYYVANKLMKGYIGSANIDTNSRLCMSSPVAAHKRAFGSDTVPGCYDDMELADLVVLVGSNLAWCHPILYQRVKAAKERRKNMKVVVIDPRVTATCEIADLHLPLRPGTDVLLFNGLLAYLAQQGLGDLAFLEERASGFAAAVAAANAETGTIPDVAEGCVLPEADVAKFFSWFAQNERVVTGFSQGVNQSNAGTDKCNTIINCHLFTGRIGRPGMGPFSITGQPNAMGGREVGGLANQLAAHFDLDNPAHQQQVKRFWRSPVIAEKGGLKAVELFDAIHDGRVKAVWIMATNPVVSLPDANKVKEALSRCPLVVVTDMTNTDTTALAHVVFPVATWGEREGTVTNSERCISRQRAFLERPGESQPDWWIIGEVAKRMGFGAGFPYQNPHEIFQEHASLSGFENEGQRDFDISGLAGLLEQDYESLTPLRWPVNDQHPAGTDRMFGEGRFYTPDGKARLVPVKYRPPVNALGGSYPMTLNTGRVRDHWHTMTRTGQSPRLSSHLIEPYAEIHPIDAARRRIVDGSLVRLRTAWGKMSARAKITADQRPGSVFVPIHWSGEFASDGLVGALVNPVVDPISGEPELKQTPVQVEAITAAWHGFVLTRGPLAMAGVDYWVKAAQDSCWRYEMASETAPDNWSTWAALRLARRDTDEWLEYQDRSQGRYRAALLQGGQLMACVFVAPDRELPSRSWLTTLFSQPQINDADRMGLLAGRSLNPQADAGEIVCACFRVGRKTLIQAISRDGLNTVEAIGKSLKAGTNCGSCIPELNELITEHGWIST